MLRPLDDVDLHARVQDCIDAELAHQRDVLAEVGPEAADLVDAVATLLAGGKRLRASFVYWGYRAAGRPDSAALVRLASAMEFFQAAALIHDDVMDDSDIRRGQPAAHRALAAHHVRRAWLGDAERFGVAGAILAGNLCLGWTEELYATSGLAAQDLMRGRPVFDRMRAQLMAGQFLDVVESVRPHDALSVDERLARADQVIRYKSAKYTIEHPLLIGATVGGVAEPDLALLSVYGLDLGHAFQLRDDLLGVFGDPVQTGKPAGDDLREGKRTVLVAHTVQGATPGGRALLEGNLGRADLDDARVEELRAVISGSGAVEAVETQIARLAQSARAALAATQGIDPVAREALDGLVESATARAS
ncbi:MAG: polyprenyl synthetase family protein [Phycicoccus sp.]|nr:polyprenyl synthetase family protein [Phycicoccus sp.]